MRHQGKQKPTGSVFDESLSYLSRHKIITDALKEAAIIWQKETKAGIPEHRRKSLPKTHPVHTAVKVDFESLVSDNLGLNYPRLIKIQIASSKGMAERLKPIRDRFLSKRDAEQSDVEALVAGAKPAGSSLYYAYSKISDPFLDLKGIEIWEAGFKAGLRHAASERPANPRPDRTMARSDQFWLTYEAWLILETNAVERKRVNHTTFPAQVAAILGKLGVIETGDSLQFPTQKHGTFKKVKVRTLEDNLTDWVNDFRALAQIPK